MVQRMGDKVVLQLRAIKKIGSSFRLSLERICMIGWDTNLDVV